MSDDEHDEKKDRGRIGRALRAANASAAPDEEEEAVDAAAGPVHTGPPTDPLADDVEPAGDEDVPVVELAEGEMPAGAPGAPQEANRDTKEFLRNLKKQKKLRLEQQLAEAREMEKRVKMLEKRLKQKQKLRLELARHTEYVKSLAPQLGYDINRPITEVPDLPPDHREVEVVTVQEGRSYIRISYDEANSSYRYEALEPQLTSSEQKILDFIRDTLVRTLDGRRSQDDEDWEEHLLDAVDRAILDHSVLVDDVSKQRIEYYIVRDFLGYGPIEVLMRDPMIEDISCDGPGIPVYIFHRQYDSIRTNVIWNEEMGLDSFVIRLAQRCGKHISIAEPILDATLPDKSRLQATLAREVTTRGSSFTIRKFRADPLTPPDLIRLGTMDPLMAAWFWMAIENGSSTILAGGTASGKTTSLNAICQFIPPGKKVVSIEDTREINIIHENWIAGITRHGFGGQLVDGRPAGSIDMFKLLEAALRQRPEFLLVGEVRGAEAKTLFQAMATGHATYSTMHADSVSSAVYRLENPPISVPRIMVQTVDAIAIQTQVRLGDRMVRRIKELTEIVGMDPETGDLLTNKVFTWDGRHDRQVYSGTSSVLENIREKKNWSHERINRELEDRTAVMRWMVDSGVRHIKDVTDVLAAYYSNPDAVLEKVHGDRATRSGPADEEEGPGAAA